MLEYLLLGTGSRAAILPLTLAAAAALLAIRRRHRERHYPFLLFEEAPIDSFQTLAINE